MLRILALKYKHSCLNGITEKDQFNLILVQKPKYRLQESINIYMKRNTRRL